MSKFLAVANGRDVKLWPAPCEVCGVETKMTPAGRWHIEHAYPHVAPGVFATAPRMIPPPKIRDPLLDDAPRAGQPELVGTLLPTNLERGA